MIYHSLDHDRRPCRRRLHRTHLGQATPTTTLQTYAHLFDEAANIVRVRDYITGQFANLVA